MELRFLGQSYSKSLKHIDTEKTNETRSFLGQKYALRRPVQSFKSELGLRKYRGVTYGV